jgi:hypothetical protein
VASGDCIKQSVVCSSQDTANSNQVTDSLWQWCIKRCFDSANEVKDGQSVTANGSDKKWEGQNAQKMMGQVSRTRLQNEVEYSRNRFREFSSLAVREELVSVEKDCKKSQSVVRDSEDFEAHHGDEHRTNVMGKINGNVRVENAIEVIHDASVESIDKYLYLRREQRCV